MNWSTQKPTKPGWYWFLYDHLPNQPFICELVIAEPGNNYGFAAGELVIIMDDGDLRKVSERETKFAGPIPEPTE